MPNVKTAHITYVIEFEEALIARLRRRLLPGGRDRTRPLGQAIILDFRPQPRPTDSRYSALSLYFCIMFGPFQLARI